MPTFPLRRAVVIATGLFALLSAGTVLAQASGPVVAQQAVFCIANQLNDTPVAADIHAGKAMTKVTLPPRQQACCIKFCSENPAPYQVALTVQPVGGVAHQACTTKVARGQQVVISGTAAQASCSTGQLQQ